MKYSDVKIWLIARLHSKHGALCSDIRLDAKMAGITRGQLTQARRELKVKTINLLDRSGRPSGEYKWVLR